MALGKLRMAGLGAVMLAVPSVALAAGTNTTPRNISPFGEAATYELTNIISLQSTFGLSAQRDVMSTANGGTVGLDGGYLEVKADTQSGSTADSGTADVDAILRVQEEW